MACCSSETYTVLEYGACGDSKPIKLELNRGLKPGTVLEVKATTNIRTQFDVKDCHGNILLHVNPRTEDNVLVFNSHKNRRWGAEEKASQMPIKSGVKYILLIAYETDGYRIFINGEEAHFYKHRINNPATEFEIDHGQIFSVAYKHDEPKWAIQRPIQGLYLQEFGCGKEGPHETQLQGCNTLSWVQIIGSVNCNASRIDFNLMSCSDDIIFHFNPRFTGNCVVRNSRFKSIWGTEENTGGMPFHTNQKFVLAIVVEPHCYRTYVNGEEFVTYKHRAPVQSIAKLVISNNLKLAKIVYRK